MWVVYPFLDIITPGQFEIFGLRAAVSPYYWGSFDHTRDNYRKWGKCIWAFIRKRLGLICLYHQWLHRTCHLRHFNDSFQFCLTQTRTSNSSSIFDETTQAAS